MMKINLHLNVMKLANAAMILWICSLTLTGLALHHSAGERLPGWQILLMGWLSPLIGNFAWFANVFFLYGYLRLISGKKVKASALWATALSLDMFLLSLYTMNEGGAQTIVYGYGWGAMLWLLSIFLLLIAAGARLNEEGGDGRPMRLLGSSLFLLTICLTGYFSLNDRLIANTAEAKRLEGIAFKRGKVCGRPDPIDVQAIKNFSGILEVRLGENTLYGNYPFAQGKDLLEWGVKNVIVTQREKSNQYGDFVSSHPGAKPGAILYVEEVYGKLINAKLVDNYSGRIVFDYTWEQEAYPVNQTFYCPDFNAFPKNNEQPRKLLMQALGLPKTE